MFISTVIPLLILLCDEFLLGMNLGDTTESLFWSRFLPHADYSQLSLTLALIYQYQNFISFIHDKTIEQES